MKNKNKYVIKQVEEGYEDPDEALRKEAKRRLEEAKKPFNPLDIVTMKNIGILLIWLIIYKIFLYLGFGLVYFFITIILLIFTNLEDKKIGSLSAYSVFNPNCERIPGTLSLDAFNMGIPRGSGIVNENGDHIEDEIENELNRKVIYDTKAEEKKRKIKENAKQPLNSLCNCGSGKKYKNCCAKKFED